MLTLIDHHGEIILKLHANICLLMDFMINMVCFLISHCNYKPLSRQNPAGSIEYLSDPPLPEWNRRQISAMF